MKRKIFIQTLLFLFVQNIYAQSNKGVIFKELKTIDKKINIKVEPNINFITKKKNNRYTIKIGTSRTSYIEIQNKYVDSNFIKTYQDFTFKQSCSVSNRDSNVFYNFEYKGYTYLLVPCKICSDYFDDECYKIKKIVLKYLEKSKVNMLKY